MNFARKLNIISDLDRELGLRAVDLCELQGVGASHEVRMRVQLEWVWQFGIFFGCFRFRMWFWFREWGPFSSDAVMNLASAQFCRGGIIETKQLNSN